MQNAMIPNRDPLFFFWPQEYQNREKQKKNNRDDTCNSVSSFFWQISNASFCFLLLNSSLLRRSFQSRNKLIKKARKFALEILRGIIKQTYPSLTWNFTKLQFELKFFNFLKIHHGIKQVPRCWSEIKIRTTSSSFLFQTIVIPFIDVWTYRHFVLRQTCFLQTENDFYRRIRIFGPAVVARTSSSFSIENIEHFRDDH